MLIAISEVSSGNHTTRELKKAISDILLEVSLTVNTSRIFIIEIRVIFLIRTTFPHQAELLLIKLSIKIPNFSL